MTQPNPPRSDSRFPLAEADRCVLCGLCLPHCPTYRLTQDENESPRGRISLMRAMASGELTAAGRLATHLSRCLGCRACERACPSGVRYGQLLEAGRHLLRETNPGSVWSRLRAAVAFGMLTGQRRLRLAGMLLRLYQRSGMAHLLRRSGVLHWLNLERQEALLPELPATQTWQTRYPAHGTQRGRVALFLGCLARELDADTISAAIRALTRLGYAVVIPPDQGCCGALHREAGASEHARSLAAQNRRAFAQIDAEAVLTLVSGCGAVLAGVGADPDAGLTVRVQDINQFLSEVPLGETLSLAPLASHVAVQDPCSLRNVLRTEQGVYRLLARIPELRLSPLPENHLCCGGAGSYALREPQLSERLRGAKLAVIDGIRPDVLVSANLGCALHLRAGLRASGSAIEVLHPITLFERQLRGHKESGTEPA